MSTDANGVNSYFHCLIFYEEVDQKEIIVEGTQRAPGASSKRMTVFETSES
jgi:hypothetical protein